MYVEDMSLTEAQQIRAHLEGVLRGADPNGAVHQQTVWDLEDVEGRIDELTDWY